MSKKINDIMVKGDFIYLKISENSKKNTVCINLKERGLYGENERNVVEQIIKYAMTNEYEFNSNKNVTRPYFLTMKNIKIANQQERENINKYNLFYNEYKNAVAEINQELNKMREYIYSKANVKINEDGEIEVGEIHFCIHFSDIKEIFKEPIKINYEDYEKAVMDVARMMCKCRYFISNDGHRYIVIKNEKTFEEEGMIKEVKDKFSGNYLELITKRNEKFKQFSGIEKIYMIDNKLCIDDNYCECLSYDLRKKLINHLEKTEVLDKMLEKLWDLLEDVPFCEKEGIEYLDGNFLDFQSKITTKEDIWHWFDARYSKGVHHLLYEHEIVNDKERICYTETDDRIPNNKNDEYNEILF